MSRYIKNGNIVIPDDAEMERRAQEMVHQIWHPTAFEWKDHMPIGRRAGVYHPNCGFCQLEERAPAPPISKKPSKHWWQFWVVQK